MSGQVAPRPAGLGLRPGAWWALLALGVCLSVLLVLWPPPGGPRGEAAREDGPQVPAATQAHAAAPRSVPRAGSGRPGAEVHAPFQAAEVELIRSLAGDEPDTRAAVAAIKRLRGFPATAPETVRRAAEQQAARYEALLDGRAREAVRRAAGEAEDLLARERFSAAQEGLNHAVETLPEASPWARQTGVPKLRLLSEQAATRKAQALAERLKQVEARARAGETAAARTLTAELEQHPEPEFRAAAQTAVRLLDGIGAQRRAEGRNQREAAAAAWRAFFRDYDAALAAADAARAAALWPAGPPPQALAGGVEAPAETLAGFRSDAEAVQALFADALRGVRARVGQALPPALLTGPLQDVTEGVLEAVDGRNLKVLAADKAHVNVRVENLGSTAWLWMLGDAPRDESRAAVWTLAWARREWPRGDAEKTLREKYRQLHRGLPAHWERRFKFERDEALRAEIAPLRTALEKAVAARDAAGVLKELPPLRKLLTQPGAAPDEEDKELLAAAERLVAGVQLVAPPAVGPVRQVVFQNGRTPAPDYKGLHVCQLAGNPGSVEARFGLTLGSRGGLLRALLSTDNLAAAGHGKVRKAVLELHQLSAQAEGLQPAKVQVVLYRLKKPWRPDAVSWEQADTQAGAAWSRPGANGPDDIQSPPEARFECDGQKGVWRSWDVTAYVRDVLSGQAPNHGLLLRILKDEPTYEIRFYPEGELEGAADPALRPRLVLDMEGN